ncbi:MAG TPA: hypothetical protein VGB52_00225 [Actinomycetota bacterium]
MRRLTSGLLLIVALGTFPARAETVWDCEQDGRVGGRPSGLCTTAVAPGSYELVIQGLNRESSGELHFSVGEQLSAECLVLAGLWQCDQSTAGAGQAGEWPTFAFELSETAQLQFRIRPPECGTITCDRDPQVITGRFRITLSTVEA